MPQARPQLHLPLPRFEWQKVVSLRALTAARLRHARQHIESGRYQTDERGRRTARKTENPHPPGTLRSV